MRIIICLLFIFLSGLPVLSQDKRPSEREVQEQLKQAMADAKQNVADQKKQIADAKLNKEDPESITEMEKRLGVMEQMVNMLEKNSSLRNKKPEKLLPPKTVEPKYVSPFVAIPLKQPVVVPTKEQAKDQLLWYSGRRIDANTLVTISGMVVRYDRVNNRVIVQPDRRVDSPHYYYGMVNTLAQTPKMKNDFVVGMNAIKNSFFMYPEIQKAYDEFDFFRDTYYDIAKNTINLPSQSVGNPLEVLHHQLIAYMATLPSPRDIQLPPERPNDLCICDEQEQEQYKIKLLQWLLRFCHEEMGLLNIIEAIYVNINAIGQQGNASLVSVPNLKQDIISAFNLVIERLTQKLEELSNRYQPSNVQFEDGLVLVTKYFQKLLYQTYADIEEQSTKSLKRDGFAKIDQIRNLLLNNTVFEKYIQEQKAALNFNALFENSLYVRHELNKKALKQSHNVEENLSAWMESLVKFNRFALSLKLDFEYEQIDPVTKESLLKANGKLESDYIIVSLGRVGDECGWHLFATDPNHSVRNDNEEEFQIPLRVIEGTKIIFQKKTMLYTGPGKMNMVYPTFKLSLCPNATNDKVMIDVLRYNDADLQRHKSDKADEVYTIDMQHFVNKMFISSKKAEINAVKLARISVDMMNIEGITLMPPSSGNQTLDKIMMNYIMHQKKRELQSSLTPETHTGNTVVSFDAKNRSSVLISKTHSTVDPADQDYEFGVRLTKGLITIEVNHSPLP